MAQYDREERILNAGPISASTVLHLSCTQVLTGGGNDPWEDSVISFTSVLKKKTLQLTASTLMKQTSEHSARI